MRLGRFIFWIVALAVVIVGIWYVHLRMGADVQKSQASAEQEPAPVTIATAQKTSFPVYLQGLGSVQAFQTVTVRTRVDGEITRILVKEGQVVKKGDLLLELDPRPYQAALDQANAKKQQDEANLANAKLDLQRYAQLAKHSFASRQQLDTQQATVRQLTAQIAGDQAAIESAATQLSYTKIHAPITGRTSFLAVNQGNIVHAADANGIMTITQFLPISVVFTEPEGNLQAIARAMAKGSVPVTALSENGSVLAAGKLAVINNQVDPATGTIQLKATFANKNGALWPGLAVDTRLLVKTLDGVVVVPENAIQHGPGDLFAYVVDAKGKAERRIVSVGDTAAGKAVIKKGINPGERVVVAGQYRLRQGTPVVIAARQKANEVAQEQAQ